MSSTPPNNEELTSLEKALAAYAIGLDIAVKCLVKVTGLPEKSWKQKIDNEAQKAWKNIPPQQLKKMLDDLKEAVFDND